MITQSRTELDPTRALNGALTAPLQEWAKAIKETRG